MEHATLGGEVWTDERGRAVVVLPAHLQGREPEYELHPTEPAVASARLADGRLTITSRTPHRKVAWRVTYRATPCPDEGRRLQSREPITFDSAMDAYARLAATRGEGRRLEARSAALAVIAAVGRAPRDLPCGRAHDRS
jgi:hypothetical protein